MEIEHYLTLGGVELFQKWFDGLKDMRARVNILRRIDRLVGGNFGDFKPLEEGICELRIDTGAGYRVYYFLLDDKTIILLGGDKSTQNKDIIQKKKLKADYLKRLNSQANDTF